MTRLCLPLCLPLLLCHPARADSATWYSQPSGSLTSRGGHYSRTALACAMHSRADWGKRYRVTDTRTGRSVVVVCNDYKPGPGIDLTPVAMRRLAGPRWQEIGRVRVTVRRVGE